jgi:hypothetical protein
MAHRMTTLLDETEEVPSASTPPMRPMYPTPSPWLERQPVALDTMMMGVVAAAGVLAGLATFAIAIAWAPSMSTPVRLMLMAIGGYLIALGLAYVVSKNPKTA